MNLLTMHHETTGRVELSRTMITFEMLGFLVLQEDCDAMAMGRSAAAAVRKQSRLTSFVVKLGQIEHRDKGYEVSLDHLRLDFVKRDILPPSLLTSRKQYQHHGFNRNSDFLLFFFAIVKFGRRRQR